MKRTLTVLATAAAIAVSTVAFPGDAEARRGWHGGWGHRHGGWGWRAPLIGGLAAGALIGGAYAYGPRYYGPGYYGYYGDCYTRRHWTPYGWRWRRVCY